MKSISSKLLIALAASSLAIIIAFSFEHGLGDSGVTNFFVTKTKTGSNSDTNGILNILFSPVHSEKQGVAQFIIKPDPYSVDSSLQVTDNDTPDIDHVSPGVVTLDNIRDGNYSITQMHKAGEKKYQGSQLQYVNIRNGASVTAVFASKANATNYQDNISTDLGILTYSAKFVCGTINGDEGPLRPGHYDTDISIYNKQSFQVNILWNAVINDGSASHAIIKLLEPDASTKIVCKDIMQLLGDWQPGGLKEGFITIKVQENGNIAGTHSNKDIINPSEAPAGNSTDLIDVQVFYTANALDTLPHEKIIDKITFTISKDPSGKIPLQLLNKPLTIALDSKIDKIYNQDERLRQVLAQNYNMTANESHNINFNINSESLASLAMIDDHAISLFDVKPYKTY